MSPGATAHEVEVRDGSHGLLVWALCLLVGALITGATVSGVISLGASAAGGAASAATEPAAYYVDALVRPAPSVTPSQAEPAAGTEAQPSSPAAATGAPPSASEADRQSLNRIFAMNTTGPFDADDKAYVAQLVASRTGLSPEEAAKRVDDVVAKARAAGEKARKYAILVAFLYAASMLASAVAAWWAATLGGKHRDERADYSHFFSARR